MMCDEDANRLPDFRDTCSRNSLESKQSRFETDIYITIECVYLHQKYISIFSVKNHASCKYVLYTLTLCRN